MMGHDRVYQPYFTGLSVTQRIRIVERSLSKNLNRSEEHYRQLTREDVANDVLSNLRL